MRTGVLFLLGILLFSPFVLGQGGPDAGVGESEYQKVKGVIDNNTPIGADGKFNISAIELNQTSAERKIEAVNLWIEERAYWLWLVFGMVPEISWLFAITLWVWLLLFTVFVMNGPTNISEKRGRLIGLSIFIVLIVPAIPFGSKQTSICLLIAQGLLYVFDLIVSVFIPLGIVAVIIVAIILVLLAIFAGPLFVRVMGMLSTVLRRKNTEKSKAELAGKILETQADALEKTK